MRITYRGPATGVPPRERHTGHTQRYPIHARPWPHVWAPRAGVYWPVAAPVLDAFLHTELASADIQSLRERARDGSLHDHLADCGTDERALPLPPGLLLRRRLQRWQEDQGRQAPRTRRRLDSRHRRQRQEGRQEGRVPVC